MGLWQAIVYGVVTTTLWVIGRLEDTRTKKIKKSDIDIREELSNESNSKEG